ncbi:hypothetical protein C8A05DRAFT_30581 [Staphylotrichum tortipilum]|uniref:Uncharacterized protein n=1 Tax=Staphylotrichum tortipilum TaxID=2831512 RepID=A0AAN6MS97_9PEZI|nr:hypothetical protein C8A05DRAFT_30581 [Staphylotrichum longicolle]
MANALRNPGAPAGQFTSLPLSPATTPPHLDEEYHDDAHKATDPSQNGPKEWISVPLQPWSIGLFISIAISLIIAIIVLLVISLRNHGFATVGHALAAYSATWRLSLLWTAFPSLVFTLLGLHWAAIASAASDRQPFVALNRPDGGLAKETVLLDYRATISFLRWYEAFRNKHWVVGLAELVVLVFSVLSPLAASLFVATSASFNQQTPVVFNGTFNQAAMNSSMDLRALLDTVTATLIYGATDHPWTDHEHAFRPFYTQFQLAGEPPPRNATSLTAPTVAHAGYLNCTVLEQGSDYEITIKSENSSTQPPTEPSVRSSAQFVMTGNDRGCSIQQEFTVSDLQVVYFVTSSQISCSVAALFSRLVFTYGHWSATDPTLLANTSVVSCAVGYRKTTGDLSVTVPSSRESNREILGFNPTEEPQDSRDDAFGFWRLFEWKLFQSSTFSVDTTWATTDFGTIILYRALQRQGIRARSNATVLAGNVLAQSISDVFTSVYLTGMATVGLVPTAGDSPETATATIVTQLTRLFVVPWVAGTVVGILAFIMAIAISVLAHARRHKTLLYEEPAGLFANAGLLEDSELIEFARRVKNSEGFDGKLMAVLGEEGKKGAQRGVESDLVRDRWKMSVIGGIVKPRVIIADGLDVTNVGAAGP